MFLPCMCSATDMFCNIHAMCMLHVEYHNNKPHYYVQHTTFIIRVHMWFGEVLKAVVSDCFFMHSKCKIPVYHHTIAT